MGFIQDIVAKPMRDEKGHFVKGHKAINPEMLGCFRKGKKPWCAGKTHKDDPRVAQPWLGKKRPELMNTRAATTMFKVGVRTSIETEFKKGHKMGLGSKRPFLKDTKAVETMFKVGDKRISGSSSWNWKGGITPTNRLDRTCSAALLWRVGVFERDDYTCQMCGKRGGTIHAHHIKPFCTFPELRHNLNNGETLCKDCHREIHRIYGYKLDRSWGGNNVSI